MVHTGFPSGAGGCGISADAFARAKGRLHEYEFLSKLARSNELSGIEIVSYEDAF